MASATASTFFSSRWGLMVAMLGMAVGTGNIWRFPRIVATQGGGSFLIAWVVFLFLWSIPLIITEFALGKALRKGPAAAFRELLGERFAWMGMWIAFVVAAIGFYYASVMGWTLRYLFAALTGQLSGRSEEIWNELAFSPLAVGLQAVAVLMAAWVVVYGVSGIERLTKVLMPILVALVVVLAVRAVTLPGAERGLAFLFTPQWGELANARVWLEALSQNAFDTGAGWGLVLTYAIYSRAHEDTNLNGVLLAVGNNAISLLAGILVLCTVFARRPDAASEVVGAGNEGLTFVWVPRLFEEIPGGAFFMVLFFLALVFAAWTSFVAVFEVGTRAVEEVSGVSRKRAMPYLVAFVFLAGLPSALWEPVFRNQDFVWSVALLVAGLFFAVAVLRFGVRRFREEMIDTPDQNFHVGRPWEWAIVLVVIQAVALIAWWFWQQRGVGLWTREGIGNMLLQWGGSMTALALVSRALLRRART